MLSCILIQGRMDMDQQLFHRVCDEVIGLGQGLMGIGTLSEKTVHSVLKSYCDPNENNHISNGSDG